MHGVLPPANGEQGVGGQLPARDRGDQQAPMLQNGHHLVLIDRVDVAGLDQAILIPRGVGECRHYFSLWVRGSGFGASAQNPQPPTPNIAVINDLTRRHSPTLPDWSGPPFAMASRSSRPIGDITS